MPTDRSFELLDQGSGLGQAMYPLPALLMVVGLPLFGFPVFVAVADFECRGPNYSKSATTAVVAKMVFAP